jgi:hypothetical protein
VEFDAKRYSQKFSALNAVLYRKVELESPYDADSALGICFANALRDDVEIGKRRASWRAWRPWPHLKVLAETT